MKRSETTNTFLEGLVMDFNPLNTPSGTLSNCLNGTLITFNGDEYVLLNDMGNGRVETASLPLGYVPLGTAELGGIIYIVSYNPLIDRCLIGSFPSPERNIAKEEISKSATSPVTNENFIKVTTETKDNKEVKINNVTSTLVKVKLWDNMKLNPGDKFVIYGNNISDNKDSISDIGSTSHKIDSIPRYVTIRVVSIGDDGKITYLDDSLKWTLLSDSEGNSVGDYYIKLNDLSLKSIKDDIGNYNTLVSSAYNVFKSKVSGQLALLFELKTIDSFTATWSATVSNYDGLDYEKQGDIFVDLNWASQFPSINPQAVRITDAKVADGIGLLLDNGEILSTASEIKKYLNSLTYTFLIKEASTVEPRMIPAKPSIRPGISESFEATKQDYIDSRFESDLIDNDIITLKGTYFRKNDGKTDKPTRVRVGQFLYNTDTKDPGTISFTVTPIMPYGDLPYLSVSNTINLLDVGTGKVTISRWKYFVNDSQTFIDFGINAYPEMGCSIDKVFLKFFSVQDIIDRSTEYKNIKSTIDSGNATEEQLLELREIEDAWNYNLESVESSYQYTLGDLTNYSGNYKLEFSNLTKDELYLVDICAKYSMPNNKVICKHNFRWLFMNNLFNKLFLDSKIIDFNNTHLNDVLNIKLTYDINNNTNIISELYIPELLLEDSPDDSGKYTAMGTLITTVGFQKDNNSFDLSIPNYQVSPKPIFENNNIFKFITSELFELLNVEIGKTEILTDAKLVESDYDTNLKNVIAPVLSNKLGLAEDLAQTIERILSEGITEELYNKMIDLFDIKYLNVNDAKTTINFNISGVSFGKINADIAAKTYNMTLTIRPLLLYTYEYSKFGLKPAETTKQTPILKYIFGEGHRNIDSGKPFAFKFGKHNSQDPDLENTESDGNPIVIKSSDKDSWNPGDSFSEENYWDNTPPYTNWLNDWMIKAGGPFLILLFRRYDRSSDNTVNFGSRVSANAEHEMAFLWVKTTNEHFIPINAYWIWGPNKSTHSPLLRLDITKTSNSIAALLMLIYYVDTTPKLVKKYTVYGINSIKSYSNTLTANLLISAKTKSLHSLEQLVAIHSKTSISNFKDSYLFLLPVVGNLIKDNVNNISFSIQLYDITDTYKLSYKINVDTDNLINTYKLTKNLEYSTYYIIPELQYNNSNLISSGFTSPINPHYLYVLNHNNLNNITFDLLSSDTAADNILPLEYCQVSVFHDDLNCKQFNENNILYLYIKDNNQLEYTAKDFELLDILKYNNNDIAFDEESLLGLNRHGFAYLIASKGYGQYYSNSYCLLRPLSPGRI